MKRLPILEPNDLVHITWLDSAGVMDMWELKEELDPIQCAHCESVGFVLDYSQEYIAICQSVNAHQVMSRFIIPLACIQSLRKL